jgi:HEAT repeat protein
MRTERNGSDAPSRALLASLVVLFVSVNPGPAQEPDRNELLAELQDRDWRIRRAAARQLGEVASQDRQVVAELGAALGDVDSRVRRSVATALGRIGPGAAPATPSLIERLQDEDPEVTLRAIRALGLIGPKASRAARHLRPLLEDSDAAVRLTAADSLIRMRRNTSASIATLADLLGDPDAEVRAVAARALGRSGKKAADTDVELVALLRDGDPSVRAAAAEAVGEIGEPTVPLLISSLNNGNPVFLRAVAEALGRVGQPAVPLLIEALEDHEEALLVRQYAAKALARIGDDEGQVVPALVERLEDENPQIRVASLEALGNLGPAADAAAQALVDVVEDRNEEPLVREYAITAAARVAPTAPEVAAALVEAVTDSDARIFEAAVAALEEIRLHDERPADGEVPLWVEQLRSADPERRLAAARGLADLGPYARDAVPALTEALTAEENDPELRAAIANALGLIGPAAEPALVALIESLRSPDAGLRDAALAAMRRIGPQTKTIPALMKALEDSDLGVRGSAALSIQNFVSARLQGWQPLLSQSDAPILRAWVSRHQDLYGIDEPALQPADLRHERATTDYFDALGGRAAIRESVQLQSLVNRELSSADSRIIPIEEIEDVDVRSHPFAEMLAESGRAPGRLPLADMVPPDHLFVYFRDLEAVRRLLEDGGNLFLRFQSAFAFKSVEYDLSSRYLARLGISSALLERLERTETINEIGLVVPDLFFIEGTDITAILRARSSQDLRTVLALTGMGEANGSKIEDRQLDSGRHVYWATREDLLFVGTSAEDLQSVLDRHENGGKDSLGQSEELQYMLQQLPVAETTQVYCYLSDPFIRKLVGPRTKIGQLRRMQARAELDMLTAGAMLFKLDGHTATPTKDRLIELGYAPSDFRERDYTIGEDYVAESERYGSSASLSSLSSNPVRMASPAEVSAYGDYLTEYSRYWRQFFDPIAIRMDRPDRGTMELTTFILPLPDSRLYEQIRGALTGADSGLRLTVPELTPAPVLVFSMNLSDSLRLSLSSALADMLEEFTSVDRGIFDALNPTVHVALQDSSPIIAIGSGDVLGALNEDLLRMEGFEPFLPILLSLISQPASVFVELAEREVVLDFLRKAGLHRPDDAEGRFHQLKGQDAWIYTLNLLGVIQLHLKVAVEGGYLVISNLPWSPRAVQTGTFEDSLNGARLELNLEAISKLLPALHTKAYSDYRIAAVDGMGYLYPLLASGTVATVAEAQQKHQALFGFKPVHPASGEWLWQDGEMASSIFGTAQDPVQPPYLPGDRDFGLFPTLRSLSVSMQLEDTGLRARIRWRSAAVED